MLDNISNWWVLHWGHHGHAVNAVKIISKTIGSIENCNFEMKAYKPSQNSQICIQHSPIDTKGSTFQKK